MVNVFPPTAPFFFIITWWNHILFLWLYIYISPPWKMREGRGLKPSMMSLSNIKVITKLFVKCVNFSHKIKNVLSVFLLILPLHFVFWGWGYKLLTFPNYKKKCSYSSVAIGLCAFTISLRFYSIYRCHGHDAFHLVEPWHLNYKISISSILFKNQTNN